MKLLPNVLLGHKLILMKRFYIEMIKIKQTVESTDHSISWDLEKINQENRGPSHYSYDWEMHCKVRSQN